MSTKPEETMTERERLIHEWRERNEREPWRKRNFLLAGGSVKTKHVIDSQEICRIVKGKA